MSRGRRANSATIAKAAAAAATAAAQIEEGLDPIDIEDLGDDASELTEALASLDDGESGIVWELYCTAPFDKLGLVRKMLREELPGLRDELLKLGPGSYQLRARGREGRYLKKAYRIFKVSNLAKPPTEALAPRPNPTDPLLLMKEFEDRIEKRAEKQKSERWETIKLLAPLLAPIGVKLVDVLFGSRNSTKDLVETLVALKTLNGDGGSEKTLDAMFKGIELAKQLGGADGTGRSWPDLVLEAVKEVAPMAKSMIEQRQNGAPAQPPSAAALPAPAANPSLPQPVLGSAEGNDMLALVRPLLEKLAADLEDFAANSADPGLAAEALMGKIPKMIRSQVTPEQLREWLNNPQWWQIVVGFRPTLMPYQGYCDDVRADLLAQVEEEINPSSSSANGEEPGATHE